MSNFRVKYVSTTDGSSGYYVILERCTSVHVRDLTISERCRTDNPISAARILAALRCCERRTGNSWYVDAYREALAECSGA